MMGNIMSTAAGVAAGHVAGRAIDRAIWGSGSGEGAEQGAPVEAYDQGYDQGQQLPQQGEICGFELMNFRQCLERNNNDATACQWNYDALLKCQNPNQEQPQANF
mmetsp:Transcript_36240/g.144933  ORF Transcript_36240/g.144933 Transcript_36240/m.144933 type:complete len:105 (+) Transcript_36240:472-786(+)